MGCETVLGPLASSTGEVTEGVISVETETGATVRGATFFDEKTGGSPGGLASERTEREPDNKNALESKVPRETLRFRRDALAW